MFYGVFLSIRQKGGGLLLTRGFYSVVCVCLGGPGDCC